jgi:c-di-GMP-binding flagellar brake protein YcgR
LDILCRRISGNKDENTAQVNPDALISVGGLSFISDELINPGEHLALMLVFQPATLGLTCFCEVRHCRLADDRPTEDQVNYRIGIKFINLDTTNQRLISRHIIRAQGDKRRSRLRDEHDVDRP